MKLFLYIGTHTPGVAYKSKPHQLPRLQHVVGCGALLNSATPAAFRKSGPNARYSVRPAATGLLHTLMLTSFKFFPSNHCVRFFHRQFGVESHSFKPPWTFYPAIDYFLHPPCRPGLLICSLLSWWASYPLVHLPRSYYVLFLCPPFPCCCPFTTS